VAADEEHKATIRLIGGRVYPLRLDFFKFKEKKGSHFRCCGGRRMGHWCRFLPAIFPLREWRRPLL